MPNPGFSREAAALPPNSTAQIDHDSSFFVLLMPNNSPFDSSTALQCYQANNPGLKIAVVIIKSSRTIKREIREAASNEAKNEKMLVAPI